METGLQRASPPLPKADSSPDCLKVIHLNYGKYDEKKMEPQSHSG